MTIQEMKDRGLLLFECVSGSRAYGLATATSDTDIKGVYYLSRDQFFGLTDLPQISDERNDKVYYELGRFVELLLRNNPNILEMLAAPEEDILFMHPVMKRLNISSFLSKLCKDTFAGYAVTQIRKARGLKKKIMNPFPIKRKPVTDFCYVLSGQDMTPLDRWLQTKNYRQQQCGLSKMTHSKGLHSLFYDQEQTRNYKGIVSSEASNEVSLSSIPKGATAVAYLFFNQDAYSIYCKEHTSYWNWVKERNEARYQQHKEHGEPYDAKNMMHTLRLLQVTHEILSTGQLNVRRPNRKELLDIKSGQYSYETLLSLSEATIEKIEQAAETCSLPERPDNEEIEKILVKMREELYQT
ncbi:hypothetical protein PBAL39_12252 [Pedobacter sp. BAL39]|uniref:DNA polymerase beta superfamily protein n=1 Tax=Pedobacter sp. BAL39 TaxID=391596 RepID=UPI000155A122|nr:nucleotidyltransferase domain-containing protein [Pedobacter sp. BAL39]EDM36477.1 hypothetical protein PBAL39_12252 [Pedobacter sp. BAL39]